MRSRRAGLILGALALVASAACGDPDPAPEGAPIVAASVVGALFDSIAWASPAAAMDRGATVYAYSCTQCHGARGAGDGGYQIRGRLLRPPSFLTDDWRFAMDFDGLRATILQGSPRRGMPHWSEKGLTPRDADAVARYITWGLWDRRP